MKRIEAIIKPHKLDEVMDRLRQIGISGVSATEVKGFGRTGGKAEVHRGSSYVVALVPKILITIVVKESMATDALEAITTTAMSGKVGDGKIFVSTVEEALRIRTGESGEEAL